jgi:hypothetical protein
MRRLDAPGWRLLLLAALVSLLSGCGIFGGSARPTPTPAAQGVRTISIISPASGATVMSPILVNGAVSVVPAGGNLNYRLFGSDNSLLAQGQLPAQGAQGGPGVFSGSIAYSLAETGLGRIELLDLHGDGAILAASALTVTLSATPSTEATPTMPPTTAQQQIFIETPLPQTVVGSPVVITGRTSLPPTGSSLSYVLRDAAGGLLGQGSFPVQTTATGTGAFNAALSFSLPPNGGNIALEVFDLGTGGAPRASTRLDLVVAPPQAILIDSPPPGTQVGSPLTMTGRTARLPFQGNLGYRVRDASGRELGRGTVPVIGSSAGPSSFNAPLTFELPPMGGRIVVELVDQNAASNLIAANAQIELNVAPQPQVITIESPPPGTQVGSPMTVTGRTVRMPTNGRLSYRVFDRNGAALGTGSFGVSGSQESGARFNAQIAFNLPQSGGPISLELLEPDPANPNGPAIAIQTLNLTVASPAPTTTPLPTATPAPTRQAITIDTPPAGTVVGSPVVLSGRVALYPQFRELYYVIRTPTRETLGQGSFPVAGQPGQTNLQYVASLSFAVPRQGGPIIVEIYDRDGVGQIITSAIVQLRVNPQP